MLSILQDASCAPSNVVVFEQTGLSCSSDKVSRSTGLYAGCNLDAVKYTVQVELSTGLSAMQDVPRTGPASCRISGTVMACSTSASRSSSLVTVMRALVMRQPWFTLLQCLNRGFYRPEWELLWKDLFYGSWWEFISLDILKILPTLLQGTLCAWRDGHLHSSLLSSEVQISRFKECTRAY